MHPEFLPRLLESFSASVHARHPDLRIARIRSTGGHTERFLLAPAQRFKDSLPLAQRARQADAGALPPEVHGEDLFELLLGPVFVSWDGTRTAANDEGAARAYLARWLDESTPEGRRLARCAERLREGVRAAEREGRRLTLMST